MTIRWTKQYWALRKGAEWKLLDEKIASPLAAMVKCWGNDVLADPVLALGLEPTPIERGSERWVSTFEIVDLGRNKKVADKTFKRLNEQAKGEREHRKLVMLDIDAQVEEVMADYRSGLDSERLGKCFQNSGPDYVATEDFDERLEESVHKLLAQEYEILVRPVAPKIRPGQEPQKPVEPKTPRAACAIIVKQIATEALSAEGRPYDYGRRNKWKDLWKERVLEHKLAFRTKINEFLATYKRRDAALKIEAERDALRRRSLDEILKAAIVSDPSASPAGAPPAVAPIESAPSAASAPASAASPSEPPASEHEEDDAASEPGDPQ